MSTVANIRIWTKSKSVQWSQGINTQGEGTELSAEEWMRCRDSPKYAQERMYKGRQQGLVK
jgi:hypothetical protein